MTSQLLEVATPPGSGQEAASHSWWRHSEDADHLRLDWSHVVWPIQTRKPLLTLTNRDRRSNIIELYFTAAESNEDNIDAFNKDLDNALNIFKYSDINIIVRDFNANIGRQNDGYTVGK